MGGNWLMKWDEVKKSHGTVIHWCTGREWLLNCMTVFSAWRRSNMRFQRSSWRLSRRWTIYSSVKTEVRQFQLEIGRSYRRDVVGKSTPGLEGSGPRLNWSPEKMLIRCSKESHHPAEWASGPPVEHQENKKDTTLTAIRVGSKYCSFCSVSNSLSQWNPTQPFRTLQINWEVHIFIKNLRSSVYLSCRYDAVCICRCESAYDYIIL